MAPERVNTLPSLRRIIRKLRGTSKTENKLSKVEPTATTTTTAASTVSQPRGDDIALLTAAEAAKAELTTLITALKSPNATITNKRKMLNATYSFIHTLHGPVENAMNMAFSLADLSMIAMAMKFRLLHCLPATSLVVANKTGIAVQSVDRILRFLRTCSLLNEDQNGVWTTTKEAAPYFHDTIGQLIELVLADYGHLAFKMIPYLEEHPTELRSNEGVFKFSEGKPLWAKCEENPELALKLTTTMEGFAIVDKAIPIIAKVLTEENQPTGIFLDLGGGNGHVVTELAKITPPGITFEVQDTNAVGFEARHPTIPSEIQKRVSFRNHDFFAPQPAFNNPEPVSAIYFRRVLHDWSDDEAVRILRHVVAVMEADPTGRTALLINETVLPEKDSLYRHEEKFARRVDLTLWLYLNTRDRTLREWRHLLNMTDPRLYLENVLWEDLAEGMTTMAVLVIRLKKN